MKLGIARAIVILSAFLFVFTAVILNIISTSVTVNAGVLSTVALILVLMASLCIVFDLTVEVLQDKGYIK